MAFHSECWRSGIGNLSYSAELVISKKDCNYDGYCGVHRLKISCTSMSIAVSLAHSAKLSVLYMEVSHNISVLKLQITKSKFINFKYQIYKCAVFKSEQTLGSNGISLSQHFSNEHYLLESRDFKSC